MARAFEVNVAEFRDNQGKIHRGKLYIGTFGNDAKETASSVTLYSDEAQSQTIANPIDLDIEGSPGLFYVPGGRYSYAVYDSSGKLAKGVAKATGHVDTTASANTNFSGTLDADGYLVGTLADEVTEIQIPVKGSTFDGAYIEGAQAADGVAGGWTEVLAYYNGLDTPVAIPANIKVFGDTDGNTYQFTGANPNSDPESDGGTNWTRISQNADELIDDGSASGETTFSSNEINSLLAALDSPTGTVEKELLISDGVVSGTAGVGTDPYDGFMPDVTIGSADGGLIWTMALPKRWDLGDIDVVVYWTDEEDETPANWVLSVDSVAIGSGDSLNGVTFGTADNTTVATTGNNTLQTTTVSGHTIASPADADLVLLRVRRLGTNGSDDYTDSISILKVVVKFNSDQGNDD